MKKIFAFSVFLLFFVSSVSAEIIINQQPNPVYNYGDGITIPVTVKSATFGTLRMNLVCNGIDANFYTNGYRGAGEEIHNGFLIFDRVSVANPGLCRIRVNLNAESATTSDFKISNAININFLTNKTEYNPGETVLVDGTATKENGQSADGFVDLLFVSFNSSQNLTYKSTLNNGFFSASFVLPKDTKADKYILSLNAYEKNADNETINAGFATYGIHVNQVPTNLEIVRESSEVDPEQSLRIKAILRDQTGEKIPSTVVMSLVDNFNEIRGQMEKPTDEFWEYPIVYNEAPAKWNVIAISEGVTGESDFTVKEREIADIKIINSTLVVINKGNVPYNESLTVKIDYEPVKIAVFLGIDEMRKYSLKAPDGEYYVEVLENGEAHASETISLTGKAVSVEEASKSLSLTTYPVAWVFVVLVLGFVFAMVLRKGYQRSFFGYMTAPRKDKIVPVKMSLSKKENLALKSRNRAELSLSLKGDKESSSLVLLKIKNVDDIKGGEAEKVLQNAIDVAEDNKAIAYISEGYGNIMFILAPITTRTFKNEKAAIEIAQKINNSLQKYNHLAKIKIDYGISLNSGDLVVRKDGNILKFMSFGNSMNHSKKVASLANGEILLTEEARQRVFADRPVDRQTRNGFDVYVLKEPKFKGDASKFIDNFKRRLEKDKY